MTAPAHRIRPEGRDVSYRDRVYGGYVSAFKGRPDASVHQDILEKRARVYDHLLGPLVRAGKVDHLLEVGCGQGQLLYWARQRGIEHAHGCDLSPEQIEVAHSLGVSARLASYGDYLPRYDDCDLIVGIDIIEHLKRDEAFELLDLCYRSLRPGGRLFLTTPNGLALRPGNVIYGDLTHETIFCPGSITTALKLAGFGRVVVREMTPPPTSIRSRVRAVLWQFIRLWPMAVDIVETGGCSSRVLTRVMTVCAERPVGCPS